MKRHEVRSNNSATEGHVLDVSGLRDLAPDVIDEQGLPHVMPARFYAQTTAEERAWLGNRFGLYCLPTEELCDWLRAHLGQRPAVEIGAGNGRMAERVGIPATDSYMQDDPAVRAHYERMGQPPVRYGPSVSRLEAKEAVRSYHPAVVIGAWVTHRYNRRQHWRGGNQYGPDIDWVLRRCEEYILIGNEMVHARSPLWERPHELYHFPWLYSRAVSGRDLVAIWKGDRR